MNQSETIACTLPMADLQKRKDVEIKDLVEGAINVTELENGYDLQFNSDETWYKSLTNLIAQERQCCAFLHFELVVPPHHGPISLRILGSPEVKEFVGSMFIQKGIESIPIEEN